MALNGSLVSDVKRGQSNKTVAANGMRQVFWCIGSDTDRTPFGANRLQQRG